MHLTLGKAYYVFNEGNNKEALFFRDSNYELFKMKAVNLLAPVCTILGWCLTPQNFHFLIVATRESCALRDSFGIKSMQVFPYRVGLLLSSYSQLMNKQNGRTGSLFRQKTKSFEISKDEIADQLDFIHDLPLRTMDNGIDWPHSSLKAYIEGIPDVLCDPGALQRL